MAAFFLYLATVDDAVGHKSVCGGRMPARPLRPLRPVMPTLTHVANFLQVHVVHVEVNGFFTVSARHVPAGAGDHVENRPQRLQNLHVDEADSPYVEAGETTEALSDMGKNVPCADDAGQLRQKLRKR